MTLTDKLQAALDSGVRQIGQLIITPHESGFTLHHTDDQQADFSSLEQFSNPEDARQIGLYGPDGEYRFTKGQLDLKTGWLLSLSDIAQLRQSIDAFYPASLGLWSAWKDGSIRIQNLRDKLSRQTGMYRYAGTVSDEGAQELVQTLCGPGNNCVKKILWKLDAETPLTESEASQFDGVPGPSDERTAIPLVCQEACNFFVAECRKKAKKEFEAANA